jgi:hypothetical protein
MRVLFTQSLLHTSPATLPLLAWQFVIIQMVDGTRVIDPVLAFARESTIFFFQVNQIKVFIHISNMKAQKTSMYNARFLPLLP